MMIHNHTIDDEGNIEVEGNGLTQSCQEYSFPWMQRLSERPTNL
jgi:hypothetical protein